MAAVAVTFSRYFVEMAHVQIRDSVLAAIVLAILTIINCLGVRAGSTVQSILMVLKIVAIVGLVVCGLLMVAPNAVAPVASGVLDRPVSLDLLTAIGAAMVPVLFAYGGWQTATFVAGEIKEPARNLSRGLIFGVIGVVLLYLAANVVYIRVLGTDGLALAKAPASAVMRLALGDFGARIIATRHCDLNRGLFESKHVDGATCLFCNGTGWIVLQTGRQGSPTHTGAHRGDRFARCARNSDCVLGTLRTDSQLCRVDGLHFFRSDRVLYLRIQKTRSHEV
jgi:hypothetical protein